MTSGIGERSGPAPGDLIGGLPSLPPFAHFEGMSLLGRLSLIACFAGCVATQLQHHCPAPCGTGQICDATVGECRPDPCEGSCNGAQRCRSGPPPHCVDINVGEDNQARHSQPRGAPPTAPTDLVPGQP